MNHDEVLERVREPHRYHITQNVNRSFLSAVVGHVTLIIVVMVMPVVAQTPQIVIEYPVRHSLAPDSRRYVGKAEVNAQKDASIHDFVGQVRKTPKFARVLNCRAGIGGRDGKIHAVPSEKES